MEGVDAFRGVFGQAPDAAYFSPGRVNLIGEHIDYSGGWVMPMAIPQGITALVRRNGEHVVRIASSGFQGVELIAIDSLVPRHGHWTDYVIGVLLSLRAKGMPITGCDVLLSSTLPAGSGLSSSAALEVIAYILWSELSGTPVTDRVAMARDCQEVENRHIGVACGIMDQFAVANGRAGHAMLLDCATMEHQHLPFNTPGHTLLVIDSRVPRRLAESAYNDRRESCELALRTLQRHRAISKLVDARLEDLPLLGDDTVRKRARHAITEQQRVTDAAEAISAGNLHRFGQLLNASHASLRDDYAVSCPELDFIVAFAQRHPGCLGARMTGAGFGGCCIALMADNEIDKFSEKVAMEYRRQFGTVLYVMAAGASEGVRRLTVG